MRTKEEVRKEASDIVEWLYRYGPQTTASAIRSSASNLARLINELAQVEEES